MRLGDVIEDGGLRLGLMQQWIDAGALPEVAGMFDAAVAAINANEELWFEEDGERSLDLDEPSVVDDILRAAVAASAELQVEPSHLAAVTNIDFDGGNDIYCELLLEELSQRLGCDDFELDTGGETDAFAVNSLAGVAALPNLETLDLDAHGHRDGGHDLTPLRGHPTLKEVTVFKIAAGSEDLLTLPALKKLRHASALSDKLTAELKARGVEVN